MDHCATPCYGRWPLCCRGASIAPNWCSSARHQKVGSYGCRIKDWGGFCFIVLGKGFLQNFPSTLGVYFRPTAHIKSWCLFGFSIDFNGVPSSYRREGCWNDVFEQTYVELTWPGWTQAQAICQCALLESFIWGSHLGGCLSVLKKINCTDAPYSSYFCSAHYMRT